MPPEVTASVGAARVEVIRAGPLVEVIEPICCSKEAIVADLGHGVQAFLFDLFFGGIVARQICAIEVNVIIAIITLVFAIKTKEAAYV